MDPGYINVVNGIAFSSLGGTLAGLHLCQLCGAAVVDINLHSQFHMKELTAGLAQFGPVKPA